MKRTVGAWTVEHEINHTYPAGMNTVRRATDGTIWIISSKDKTEPELLLIISKWLTATGQV